MSRAILFSSTKMFFQSADNKYRYWFRRPTNTASGRLMLHIKRKDLAGFRASGLGLKAESFVDIFEVGGGWYEVTVSDWVHAKHGNAILLNFVSNGLQLWIKALNLSHVADVNANFYGFTTKYVRSSVTPPAPSGVTASKLQALANRFARV